MQTIKRIQSTQKYKLRLSRQTKLYKYRVPSCCYTCAEQAVITRLYVQNRVFNYIAKIRPMARLVVPIFEFIRSGKV